ncbi:MAG: hypothetical protein WC123_07555 [Bacilli bacterium]
MCKYIVKIDDNYHYMDESERINDGGYKTLEEAIDRCKMIVLNNLKELYKKGMDAGDLGAQWAMFGEDPFIVGGDESVPFSSYEFVNKTLCQEIIDDKINKESMLFAISVHSDQEYGKYPYMVHLGFVNYYINKYKYLLSNQHDVNMAISGGWLHDTIEDCASVNYEELKSLFGEDVADIVQALTNIDGEYNLNALKNNKIAFFVKLCDRLANVAFFKINFKEKVYIKYVNQFEDINKNCPKEFKKIADEIKLLLNNADFK